MSIAPFSSERELIDYAKWFLRDRANAFRKDIEICMTANSDRQHAYFPALITCISFLDLLSGLYAGKFDRHGAHELRDYIKRFTNAPNYAHMDLLYQMFRHKIAHIAYPYPVFDTTTKPKIFGGQKQRRVTWMVCARRRDATNPINRLCECAGSDQNEGALARSLRQQNYSQRPSPQKRYYKVDP